MKRRTPATPMKTVMAWLLTDCRPVAESPGQGGSTSSGPSLTNTLIVGTSDTVQTDSTGSATTLANQSSYSNSSGNRYATGSHSNGSTSGSLAFSQQILLASFGADFQSISAPGAMWSELDQQFDDIKSMIHGDMVVVGATGAAASSITFAVIVWAFRAGFLASGLLAQIPAWNAVDPLMIMQGGGGDGGESLEELMDRRSQALDENTPSEQTES